MFMHTCMHAHIFTHIHAHTYTFICMHTHVLACTHSLIHACTHIHIYMHTHTHICTCMHTLTHVHAHTLTHVHAHMFTLFLVFISVMPNFAEKVEIAVDALNCNPQQDVDENEFIEASRLVYDGVRDIRQAVLLNGVSLDPCLCCNDVRAVLFKCNYTRKLKNGTVLDCS